MEAAESEDEEDVFEVESIQDSKIEEGKVLYRVRWKGFEASEDTWEPEAHLEDCKEVLLEFRRKQAESKQKVDKKESPPKLFPEDLFEAESDSNSKEETPQKKKKKSKEEEEEEEDDDKLQEELIKKKSKSGKSKEKSKPEVEPESQPTESKSKKRLSESKEDLSSKKPKKDDTKDSKKSKKEEAKDTKVKEDQKEKKPKKSLRSELSKEETSPVGPEAETVSICSDVLSEDRDKIGQDGDLRNPETTPPYQAEELSFGGPLEEEVDEVKLKKKKKKHKKKNDDAKAELFDASHQDKKSLVKKQKSVEKVKEALAVEKLPAPVLKRPSTDDKVRKSVDSLAENKETKKAEIVKEKPKKKHEFEKEAKKELKVVKALKEQKHVYDAFTISSEDRDDCLESIRKEQESFDFRSSEDYKAKEVKPAFKERRSTQEETDSWTFGASEGDQEVMDTVYRKQENSEGKAQVGGMAVDLQLEWMTLEDFQRHLDGSDEIMPKDPISNSALKEAVKNGDYLTVKYALNSKEEYNLDQEDSSGMTLVMMAAAAGQDDILRLLIRKGAKINARQKNGTTALIHAAEKNYLTTVSILLEAGAFVNLQQATGETALMKACKRGNYDIVRLLIEQGADCNVLSKHQGNALQFTKQNNNVLLYEFINGHLEKLSRVVEDAIKDYFETRLAVLEPIFPIACHRLSEGPDFSLDFNYKPPYNIPEESGILLFIFHANFFGKEVVVRLSGPCSVQAVVLNDKFQLPVFLDAHFIYSFSPIAGPNKLFIRLSEVPNAKVKLLITAYRVQLH
ncbi:PREDICTED: M-phase phosphoprotein 8 [Nanorana parkeri]|uniref:M-phase phosphoprotein 8 n=1 Tax=Nanorana parkeri TaxID=125878 RepID=UPI000854EABF|nr:PREDICTED: M-phase phosphoprotein 8 [Nanorana parkeri]